MRRFLISLLIVPLLLAMRVYAEKQTYIDDISIQIPDELIPLLDLLEEKGFKLKFQAPPHKKAYGLFQSKNKTLWIAPITFALEIGRQTFLHEATHAAQSCPNGSLTPIGWELPLSPFIQNEIQSILFNHYDSQQYLIEKEALSLQGQSNGVELLITALNERCR